MTLSSQIATITSPARPESAEIDGRVLLTGDDYQVILTGDPQQILQVQRLRYQIFRAEAGYSADIGDPVTGLEADSFDAHCEHLLVRDRATGAVTGCARVLPPPRAIAAGGWYAAGEFDLDELDPIRAQTVELGRLVVDPGHRSGTVVALLWAALLQYLSEGGYRYLMGCVSIPLNGDGPRGTELRGVRDIARNRYAAPWQVYPHRKVTVDGAGLDALEPPTADRIPPLLRAYLRLGARVCGEPALDEAFDVGDLLVVLDRELADERYVARLRSAAQRLSGKTN